MSTNTSLNQQNPPMYTAGGTPPSGSISIAMPNGANGGLTSSYPNHTHNITGVGINSTYSADIKCSTLDCENITLAGQNLATVVREIQNRLNILVPNPEHVQKYAILADLYEQYKVAEALLYGGEK